eukprot:15474821-Alexandrium_andersonii.AAC.1
MAFESDCLALFSLWVLPGVEQQTCTCADSLCILLVVGGMGLMYWLMASGGIHLEVARDNRLAVM